MERVGLGSHDGRSGARLERVTLGNGLRLVVKRTTPASDLVMLLTGASVSRELLLWEAGVLDRLPPGVGHALVDAWQEGDESVLVMRDLGDAVAGWSRRVSAREWPGLLAAVTGLHREFAPDPWPGLLPLKERLTLFAPSRIAVASGTGHPLPPAVLRGWERFGDLVDADVAEPVLSVLSRPERLAAPMAQRPLTMVHGDLWLTNMAFEPDRVTLLDWDLCTYAPAALDLVSFMVGSASRVDVPKARMLDDFRAAWGADHDEVALRLALLGGLVELGWNKALDVTEHPDQAHRERERHDLAWWVAQSRLTLELGLI